MTVAYASSDIQSIVISPEQGGCGADHRREGARVFRLECDQCAGVVLGHTRSKVIKHIEGRGPVRDLLDTWPGWAGTISDIPLTTDEQLARDRQKKDAGTELERLQALAMAKQVGIPVPQALASALGGAGVLEDLKGEAQTLCPDGHANRPGARFCDLCGVSMRAPGGPEASAA